jgi:hypothetical protein
VEEAEGPAGGAISDGSTGATGLDPVALALALGSANREATDAFWSRPHLKWSEAQTYAGKLDEAKKPFAMAAGLDLAAGDKSELMRFSAKEGDHGV